MDGHSDHVSFSFGPRPDPGTYTLNFTFTTQGQDEVSTEGRFEWIAVPMRSHMVVALLQLGRHLSK